MDRADSTASSDNQHFVPQFYLKAWCPFPSKSKAGLRCVRAWNLRSGRIGRPVSIKHECSRSGFYGPKANPTDNWLTAVEGTVSNHIWNFRSAPPRMPTADEDLAIRKFMGMQMPRTRYSERETQALLERIDGLFDDSQDRDTVRQLIAPARDLDLSASIPNFTMSILAATSDLGLLVAHNDTDLEFVTSDNPVVMVNHAFPRHLNMGFRDAGLLVLLPISPQSTVVLYDRSAYERKRVASCTPNDVRAMNLIQACNARNNLYFRDDHTDLTSICAKAHKHRSANTPYVALAVADDPKDGELLHFGNCRPNPRVRFSFAIPTRKFRRKFSKQIASPTTEMRVPSRASLPEIRTVEHDHSADGVRFTQVSKIEL